MPQQRMDIRMIKDILRLKYHGGLSHEAIARSLSISKGVVAKYLGLAGAAGLDWRGHADWTRPPRSAGCSDAAPTTTRLVEPDFAHVHVELRRKGVTLMLLWEEYRAAHEGRRTWAYTQFCEHYKRFAKSLKRSMRQHRRRRREAVHRLRRPTHALWTRPPARSPRADLRGRAWAHRATPSPAPPPTRACARGWVALGTRAEFYRRRARTDRARQPARADLQACRYEPELNATVREFARPLQRLVPSGAPVFTQGQSRPPKSAVQVVNRWILARLRHRRWLRLCTPPNAAIGALLAG